MSNKNEEKERKWNPDWPSAKADTAKKRTKRKRQQRKEINEALSLLGHTGPSLATELKNAYLANGREGMAQLLESWAKRLRGG